MQIITSFKYCTFTNSLSPVYVLRNYISKLAMVEFFFEYFIFDNILYPVYIFRNYISQ